jgi:hypothetical protein
MVVRLEPLGGARHELRTGDALAAGLGGDTSHPAPRATSHLAPLIRALAGDGSSAMRQTLANPTVRCRRRGLSGGKRLDH